MPHSTVSPTLRSNAKRLRREMTDAEVRLWGQLRAHRLMGLGFRRQVPIGRYIADFACPEHRLVVELDGSQHASHEATTLDEKRKSKLGETGWTVIRFWNHEVMIDLDAVCNHILAVVRDLGRDT